ncbi:hypothetical protein GCM10023201_02870 [Actinomycetospora corticicola]|uniref:DUF4025 domain-containing protein n=1 Tax=Actinomycetospora corticicola TaxID=663602 RepID=A0A7Y9J977_9PSEU|nr:hypothetical protein [Actinomycetospora corticicola]NYD39876.1 hypothetical protein [Actinomycetospora corticicola]
MTDPSQRAANLEQQYVNEYEGTEQALTGLDPEKDEENQTKDRIEAVAKDEQAEDHVEKMADGDR